MIKKIARLFLPMLLGTFFIFVSGPVIADQPQKQASRARPQRFDPAKLVNLIFEDLEESALFSPKEYADEHALVSIYPEGTAEWYVDIASQFISEKDPRFKGSKIPVVYIYGLLAGHITQRVQAILGQLAQQPEIWNHIKGLLKERVASSCNKARSFQALLESHPDFATQSQDKELDSIDEIEERITGLIDQIDDQMLRKASMGSQKPKKKKAKDKADARSMFEHQGNPYLHPFVLGCSAIGVGLVAVGLGFWKSSGTQKIEHYYATGNNNQRNETHGQNSIIVKPGAIIKVNNKPNSSSEKKAPFGEEVQE